MKELPKGWAATTLGEIAPLTYGKALVGASRNPDGKVPVFGSSGRIGSHNVALTARETLIVGRKGTVGAVYHCAEPCWIIDTAYFIDTLQWLNWRFLYHLLSHQNLVKLDRSTAIPGLSRDDYNKVQVHIAPLGEQGRVADEIEKQFTRLDAATAALKRVQANLKRYRATVLKAACEGRLVPTEAELARKEGRDYEAAGELLQRILRERRARWEADTLAKMTAAGKRPTDDRWKQKYKEPSAPDTTNLPDLPEGWCWASLDQLAISVRNGISVKPTLEQGLAILRISAVRAMSVNLDDVRFLPDSPEFRQYALSENDLLFVRYNGNPDLSGRCGRVGITDGTIVHPDKLIRVDICFKSELSGWMEIVANFGVSRRHLELKTRTTAGQSGISGEDIKRIPIPLCPLSEAVRIVEESDRRLSTHAVLQSEIKHGEQRSASLRQSILRDAFTGQLVPQDPTDEPASVLLERIRAERAGTGKGQHARTRRRRGAS